jgi:hypothetical protein
MMQVIKRVDMVSLAFFERAASFREVKYYTNCHIGLLHRTHSITFSLAYTGDW